MAYRDQQDLMFAYTQMCMDRLALGYQPTMITIMYHQMPGSPATVARNMDRAIEALYANILTHMFRHPNRMPVATLPLWITCPDFPVYKIGKMTARDVSVNDGAHRHVATLTPPQSRLDLPFNLWLEQEKHRYTGPGRPIARIDVVRIYETPEKAFSYAIKSLGRGRATSDDVLLLPRTHEEMNAA